MEKKYINQLLREECGSCYLCENGPCASGCDKGMPVDRIIRSVYFDNIEGACKLVPDILPCESCDSKSCIGECLKGKVTSSVKIPEVLEALRHIKQEKTDLESKIDHEPDISMEFCGIHCENPFFLSSSIVGSNYEMIAKAFDLGWGGVVYKTITSFTHKEVSPRFATTSGRARGFEGFKNLEESSEHSLEENIEIMRRLKREYPNKIVIASIMGMDEDDWTYLARELTTAGVDALECNFSCPHMAYDGLGSDVGEDPILVEKYVKAIKKGSNLPLIAKMTANVTSVIPPALAAIGAGADALAAINTVKSIINVSGESYTAEPNVAGRTAVSGYSGNAVRPIACRFVYDMTSEKRLSGVPVSGMGGIENWHDALEFFLLGCTNIQVTTAVMQYGYRIIEDITDGIRSYLVRNNIEKLSDVVGKALTTIVGADELDRDSICYPKFDLSKCVGCGRCVISCYDGGHQALTRDDGGRIRMNPEKCVGCHLCLKVCPTETIGIGKRIKK